MATVAETPSDATSTHDSKAVPDGAPAAVVRQIDVDVLPLTRLTVTRYDLLVESGALREEDNCELIDGLLVTKMVKGSRHVVLLQRLRRAIEPTPGGWYLSIEDPLKLERSKPEPNVMLVRGRLGDIDAIRVTPDRVALVLEVSDSSLALDRGPKALAYAAGGVSRYVVVDIPNRAIWLHTEPSAAGYGSVVQTDAVRVTLDGTEIAVSAEELFAGLGEM